MPTAYDPTSTAPVLRYTGDGKAISGVPARDLNEHDVCRIAYERALAAVALEVGQPIDRERPELGVITRPDPRRPEGVQAVVDELLSRGVFEAVKSKKPAPAPTGTPTEA